MIKIIKNTCQIIYGKKFHITFLCDKNFHPEEMTIFFQDIDNYLINAKAFFKKDFRDTSTVGVVTVNQKELVVKRYNIKNFFHGLKLQFRTSHAYRSFYYANLLPGYGIPAIKPVGVIQKRWGIIKKRSYFISQYEQGLPGCVYFKDDSSQQTTWNETIHLILQIIKKMQENRIYHGDFHFGNFLIVNQQPILLDFDRIKKVKNLKRFKKLHQKDLTNFVRYLKRNPQAYSAFKKHPENIFI